MGMEKEFRLVARDFFLHEYTHLKEYESADYVDLYSDPTWPDAMLTQYTMSLMVNAANSGSEYAKALILYLYRLYYRKEYKTLRKFRRLSLTELIALAKPDREHPSYDINNARILYIAKLSDIEIGEDCNVIYAYLNDSNKSFPDAEDVNPRIDIKDILGKCRQEVQEKHESKRMYNVDAKMLTFLNDALSWYGYPTDYVEMCDEENSSLSERLSVTLAILKKKHPTKEYTLTELSLYATIFHCVGALTSTVDWIADTFDSLALGVGSEMDLEEDEIRFRPEEIQVASRQVSEKVTPTMKPATELKAEPMTSEEKEIIRQEMNELRRKLHMLETDNADLRLKLNDKRKLEDEIRRLRERDDEISRELTALRAFAYNQTEDDVPSAGVSVEHMKEAIAKLRIVVIGGHSNWVYKLRNMFSNWTFVNPEAGGSTDASIVEKADYAFFFTDTISHSRYYQFMKAIREKKVDFCYIHGVNIENNIRDIYREIYEAE
ncbi:MAG: hypothetical protein IK038_10270 [Bacteroidaceae bacterium]|nr:hypothetical protein [Bacteroidaceae bacterium]